MSLLPVVIQRLHGTDLLLAGVLGRAAAFHGGLDIVALNSDQRAAISQVHVEAEAILRARVDLLSTLVTEIDRDGEVVVLAALMEGLFDSPQVTGTSAFSALEAAKVAARRREIEAIVGAFGGSNALCEVVS